MQEQVAKSFIDALKGQPLSLALVVMNILLIGFLYYDGVAHNAERKEELQMLYKNRELVAELLFKCQPPSH